jgi:ubiquitin-protein ligase
MATNNIGTLLRPRLLRDIAELQSKPYPGIQLHVHDEKLHTACLVLSPEEQPQLHLMIEFHDNYPLSAPQVTIQSRIEHPNVFDSYICASILNTDEGYTPAYTLKGICIQLLSFFASDKIEQEYGGVVVDLRGRGRRFASMDTRSRSTTSSA